MANLQESLAPPIEITLAGKTYKAGKLSLGDMAEFEDKAKEFYSNKIIRMAERIYKDKIPDSVLDKAILPPTKEQLDDYQSSITGLGFLLWKALVKYNPNITQDEIMAKITVDQIDRLSKNLGVDSDKKKASRTKKKVKPR